MRADAEEEVWLGRDNVIEWVVVDRDQNTGAVTPVTDLSSTTRAVVTLGSTVVDSAVVGSGVIWWTDSVTAKILPDGQSFTGDVIRCRLGGVSGLIAGEYEECRLLIYDASGYDDGLVVSDDITITVHEQVVP